MHSNVLRRFSNVRVDDASPRSASALEVLELAAMSGTSVTPLGPSPRERPSVSSSLQIEGALPPTPPAPTLEAVDGTSICVKWCAPPAGVTAMTVRIREVGSSDWLLLDGGSGKLVSKGGEAIKPLFLAERVRGLSAGKSYEATIQHKNGAGWSKRSSVSIGLQMKSAPPPIPAAPGQPTHGPPSIQASSSPKGSPSKGKEAAALQFADMEAKLDAAAKARAAAAPRNETRVQGEASTEVQPQPLLTVRDCKSTGD